MQQVMVDNFFPNWKDIRYGVPPQASILGPLLFLMLANDMVNCIRNNNVLLYADDTVICRNDFDFAPNYKVDLSHEKQYKFLGFILDS